MLVTILWWNTVLVCGLLVAALARVAHLKGQIKELTDLVGDHVADQYLLAEARQELAETKMQLELSRAGK